MMICRIIADSPEELHAMADKIGMQRKWFQSYTKAKRPRPLASTVLPEAAWDQAALSR
jgi:hypothetical protein